MNATPEADDEIAERPEMMAVAAMIKAAIDGLEYIEKAKRPVILDSAFVAVGSVIDQFAGDWTPSQRAYMGNAHAQLAALVIGDLAEVQKRPSTPVRTGRIIAGDLYV